ncbi:MAG: hypothetical protein DSY66_05985 [Persephonella sp.]|nr:MAG: hypothetical protein DSY66_05985 [Persephonella sp.]
MSWYKLILEQIQPIHIGKYNWGVIAETEIFITGSTIWGALVNSYAVSSGIEKPSDLDTVRKKFEIITNFFPSFDGKSILEPTYKDGEFGYRYGDGDNEFISEEEFRLYFVGADFKTSIDPFTITTKEEQLYEFEYILPKPKKEFLEHSEKKGFKDKLYWIGLIKLEDEKIKNFIENKPKIFVGGDTRYGYGLMKVIEFTKIEENELEKWNLDGDGKFKTSNKTSLKNFLEFDNSMEFRGEIKLIPDFNFSQNIPIVEDAKFYINIGGNISKEINQIYKLKKGKFIKAE